MRESKLMRETKANSRAVLSRAVTWTPGAPDALDSGGRLGSAPRSPMWPLARPGTEPRLVRLRNVGVVGLIAVAYVTAVFGTLFFVLLSSP